MFLGLVILLIAVSLFAIFFGTASAVENLIEDDDNVYIIINVQDE